MSRKYCNIIAVPEVPSTNDHAKQLLKDSRPVEGSVILARYQSAGRGHGQNHWESEAGMNILMSMILYPDFLKITRQFRLSMAVALGIIDFLKGFIPDSDLFIKWPNDIYVGDLKIGGILINNEIMGNSFEYAIVGIGINVNQKKFSTDIPNPVSLSKLTGKEYGLDTEAGRLCKYVLERYGQLEHGNYQKVEVDYLQHMLGMNEERRFVYRGEEITATISGVNEFGHLMLDAPDRKIECDLKEISYIF